MTPGRTLLISSLGTFIALVVYCGPLGNMPTIATALHAGPASQTWILSSMSVGLAAFLLTAGALADDLGRRRIFAGGAVILAAGSVLCAVASGPVLFIAGRVVEGIGGAALVASSLGLVAHVFTTPAQRATASGVWGASVGAGIAVGPVVTGLLDLAGLWRLFYWAIVVFGVGLGWIAHRGLIESRADAPRKVDLYGAATLSAAMVLILVALVEGRQGNARALALSAIAAVAFGVAFIVVERRGQHPMLDLRLFRGRRFSAATLAALATGVGVIGLMSFSCTFLVNTMRLSTLDAALVLVVWSGISVATALLARHLPASISGGHQLAIGLAGVGVGLLAMTGLAAESSPWRLVPGLIIAGIASGVLNAALGREAVASVPADRAGLGSGANNTARYLGSSIGVTLVGIIAMDPSGRVSGMVAGWNHAALVTGVLSLAGAAAIFRLSRRTG